MELNQPYYLNVAFLEIFFKKLGRLRKHFLLRIDPTSGRRDLGCTFLMIPHLLDQRFLSFKNPKIASYYVERIPET